MDGNSKRVTPVFQTRLKWQKLSSPPKCTFSLCEFCFCYSRTLFPYALAVLNFNRENVRFQCFQKICIKITKSRFARFCKFYANFLKTFQSHILPVSVQYRQGIRKQNSRVAQTKRTVQIYTQGRKIPVKLQNSEYVLEFYKRKQHFWQHFEKGNLSGTLFLCNVPQNGENLCKIPERQKQFRILH